MAVHPTHSKAGLNIALAIFSALVGLLLCEIGLRALTLFPITRTSNTVPHPELLYVLNPNLSDVDSHGFRNPKTSHPKKTHFDIVAIGDSHTYGFNVESKDTWPFVLARRLHKTVYNLGIGSYGVYQYARLFELALELNPEIIIVGLYPANDLVAKCELLRLDYWKQRLRSVPGLQLPDSAKCRTEAEEGGNRRGLAVASTNLPLWIKRNLATVNVLYYFTTSFWKRYAHKYDTNLYEFKYRGFSTLLSRKEIARHQKFTDLSNPSVKMHYDNSLVLFERMQHESQNRRIKFGVLIIPSHGRVIRHFAQESGASVSEIVPAVLNEESLAREYLSAFGKRQIPAVDAIGYISSLLRMASATGEPVYPPQWAPSRERICCIRQRSTGVSNEVLIVPKRRVK
jgi:hypothetical protein